MLKKILLGALMLATTTSLAVAGNRNTIPKIEWVVVSRPMMACGDQGDDDTALRQTLLDTFAHPNAQLPEGCAMLKVGEKYLLDDKQSEADTKIAVKIWAPVCPQGCVPSMTPVFAPPRRLVGIYLRLTKAPKGW
jgi:hypothetical protein